MTALKAARGAGLPWSVSEDAGRATRWLASNGADWSDLLLGSLEPAIALDPDASPFLVGARVADRLDSLTASEKIGATTFRPIWLLAMLVVNAPPSRAFVLSIGDDRYSVREGQVTASVPLVNLAAAEREEMSLHAGGERFAHVLAPSRTRSTIPVAHHAALETLVYRTYVPNSEKSRLRGAGARPGN